MEKENMRIKIETLYFDEIGIKADIYTFNDYRPEFYYVIYNGNLQIRSNCFPAKNVCINYLKSAINTFWNYPKSN